MASPTSPLELEKLPFARDCFFYALSIAMLFIFMQDHAIQSWEALTLLGAAVVFVLAVYFTSDIAKRLPGAGPSLTAPQTKGKKGKMHGFEVEVKEVLHSRMQDGGREASGLQMAATANGIAVSPIDDAPKPNKRGSVGFQMDGGENALLGNMLRYDRLKEVAVMSEGTLRLEFSNNGLQHVTLLITAETADARDGLLESIKEYDDKLWVHDYDATVFGAISHLKHAFTDPKSNCMAKIVAIPEFLIDVLLKGTLFFCDVKDITKEGRWPLCFMGAMFWLAIFSYGMLEIAGQIHYNIPAIPTAFLGITVCAIGTSFPNAVASVIMASQGKPAAAAANALGSNVQNVFLAMALPWCIFMAFPGKDCENPGHMAEKWGDLPQNAAGLSEGIL